MRTIWYYYHLLSVVCSIWLIYWFLALMILVYVLMQRKLTMVFSPIDKCKRFCSTFPPFSANGNNLTFVACFKYLGHMIEHSLSDESDINRELKCLFVRANLLNTRFWRCSTEVKLRLFKIFCMCFYDIWSVEILQSWFSTKTCFCVCEVYKDILWVP